MNTKKLDTKHIVAAGINKDSRIAKRNTRQLLQSIQRVGQIMPAIVSRLGNGQYVLLDGHRRWAVCSELGLPLECLEVGAFDPVIYAEVNANMKPHTGSDRLHAYLECPDAVDEKTKQLFKRWDKSTLSEAAALGGGLGTLKHARTVAEYCMAPKDDVLLWMLKHQMTYAVRRAIEDGTPPSTIAKAIADDQPLKRGWGVS